MVLDVIQYRIIIHQLEGERERTGRLNREDLHGMTEQCVMRWLLSKYKLQTMHEKEDED